MEDTNSALGMSFEEAAPVLATAAAEASSTPGTVTVTREDICKVLTERRKMLLSLIMRVVKDPDTADEILSQVAIQALTKAESDFRGEASLSTYIGSIAYHAACRHARHQSVRHRSGVYYDHELFSASGEDGEDEGGSSERYDAIGTEVGPDTVVEHQRLLAQTEIALEKLGARMPAAYECWKLHRLQGLPYEEIEARLNVNRVTARTRVHKFGEALKKMMGINPAELLAA